MVLHALSTCATRVVAFGYAEAPGNGIYEKGVNQWDNVYSTGYSLMKLFSKSESLEDLRDAMAVLRPGRKKAKTQAAE